MNYQTPESKGRYGDTTLVHMNPQEVAGLNALGAAYGRPLTINPSTGYPEAFNLRNLLPMIIGTGLNIASGGALTPLQAGMITGAGYGVVTGDPMKAISAGFGAAGGAGFGEGLTAAGSTAMPVQGASTVAENFARAGEGLKALGSSEGLNAFMGTSGTSAVPATGMGGVAGLAKSTAMSLAPQMTDIPEYKAPEQVSYIRPYSLDIENVSDRPYTSSAEQQQLTYRFKEEEPYRVAQGGPIRYQAGGAVSDGYLTQNPDGSFVFTNKHGTQTLPSSNMLGLQDIASRLNPSQIDPDVQKILKGYTPQQQQADMRTSQLGINEELRQQQASGMQLGQDELDILRAADEGIIVTTPEELTSFQNRPPPPAPIPVPQFMNTRQDVYQNIADVQRMAGLPTIDVPQMERRPQAMIQPPMMNQPTGGFTNYGIGLPSPEESSIYSATKQPKISTGFKFGGGGSDNSDIVGYTGAGQPVYGSLSSVPNSVFGGSDAGGAAEGGLASMREGRFLRGDGDGMSDEIPASIEGEVDALLSDGEFVIPADVVSHLGNGSSEAGARVLYEMMDRIRKERTGKEEQAKEVPVDKVLPV